ncbi:MAG: protein-tyrosine phosphatase family protein [Nitrospirota bacterium]
MTFTEFPLGLPGRVFGSPMPFGIYDQDGELFHELKRQDISVVVVLVEDEEYLEQTQRNLPAFYSTQGFQVIHLPIPNYGVPSHEPFEVAITRTIEYATASQNTLIHCSAGIGRTALFAVFLAMKVLDIPGREAIRWVGQHHPRTLLTPIQIDMILTHN